MAQPIHIVHAGHAEDPHFTLSKIPAPQAQNLLSLRRLKEQPQRAALPQAARYMSDKPAVSP